MDIVSFNGQITYLIRSRECGRYGSEGRGQENKHHPGFHPLYCAFFYCFVHLTNVGVFIVIFISCFPEPTPGSRLTLNKGNRGSGRGGEGGRGGARGEVACKLTVHLSNNQDGASGNLKTAM